MSNFRNLHLDPLMDYDLIPEATFFCDECGANCKDSDKHVRWNPLNFHGWRESLCVDCADESERGPELTVDTVENYHLQQGMLKEEQIPTFKYKRV